MIIFSFLSISYSVVRSITGWINYLSGGISFLSTVTDWIVYLPGGISFISTLAPSLRVGIVNMLPKSATCQRKDIYLGCSDII